MWNAILERLILARESRERSVLVTITQTRGSVPRSAGTKMLIFASGEVIGTIGGGKFEALVMEECPTAITARVPLLKSFPLHEGQPDSFGAICGGEVTVLFEPQNVGEAICLVGAGHCAGAIAKLALECGIHVTVIDDRAESIESFPDDCVKLTKPAPEHISKHDWQSDEALVIVSRNYEIDQDALLAGLQQPAIRYLGMIGSRRKVSRVFNNLRELGVSDELLARVYAPIGLDVGADSPAEIAVCVIAEILQVLRGRGGGHLRSLRSRNDAE
ncbi:MAG: xanthine dehydrogenase accessory factor [Chthoniobacter sp.]|jgi:xanthine dehydrogenase accessory factor|nr:xanthine dehydrogenase accessory factor [Chthoniobacter sp.]